MSESKSKPIFDKMIGAIDALAEQRFGTILIVFPVDGGGADAFLSTNADTPTVARALTYLAVKLKAI